MRKSVIGMVCALLAVAMAAPVQAQKAPAERSRGKMLDTMKRATQFMVEKVAYNGGYVWAYLPDMSRRWGEMEAYPTMVWVQPPGTATMGHLFLDAYHATGDDYYYHAAEQAAGALIAGQMDNGGWNYFIDFGGEASKKQWYDTIGKNAWRLEEFQHDWGNATFDDAGTSEAMQFLLRLYVEKRDPKYLPAVKKALNFVLDSQYPIGGWPQRWPVKNLFEGDYTGYITFNDDVAGENIRFLIYVYQVLGGDARVYDAIVRAMNVYLVTQQGQPQPGWALQYTLDLKPAAARSYEPLGLATHTTASNIRQLFWFYRLTGDTKYLARIPEALDWLESVRLPDNLITGGRAYPTFIELGTGKPLFIHRRGSNVFNGEYFADYDPAKVVIHYSSTRAINVPALRKEYEQLKATPPAEIAKDSPLRPGKAHPLPRYFLVEEVATSDLNTSEGKSSPDALVRGLNKEGYWPTELRATSNPYSGNGPRTPVPGDYWGTRVGDITDTSPFIADKPVMGISTGTYIDNMKVLIPQVAKP